MKFIVNYISDHASSPTIREIGEAIKVKSPNGVFCHLVALEKKGLLVWKRGEMRCVRPVGVKYVPVCEGTWQGQLIEGLIHEKQAATTG